MLMFCQIGGIRAPVVEEEELYLPRASSKQVEYADAMEESGMRVEVLVVCIMEASRASKPEENVR